MRHSAVEKLTVAASRLFQDRGFARVGINEIIREADVARMSLYNNFRSKEDLAYAAYTALSETRRTAIDAIIETVPLPRVAVLSIFDMAEQLASKETFRGCAFINLAAHVGANDERLASLVRRHKAALRERFAHLGEKCGATDSETLGRQLLALWDGALVDAYVEGSTAPIKAARAAAARLLPEQAG